MSAKRPSAWTTFVASAPTTYPEQYAEFLAANPDKKAAVMNFAKFARGDFAQKDYEALEKSYTAPEPSLANFDNAIASMGSLRGNFATARKAVAPSKKAHVKAAASAVKSGLPPPSARPSAARLPSLAANDPVEEAVRIANTIQEELEHLKSALGRLHGGTRKRRSLR